MKRAWKYMITVVLPLTGVSALLGACASMSECNNDSCYDRNVSSVDPYDKGDVAAWGTEKKVKERDDELERRRSNTRVLNRR